MGWPEEQLTPVGRAAAADMLQCVVCLDVLRDAVSCPTQHGICAECHENLPSPASCPQCRTRYDNPPPALRLARQLVDKLEIHCKHHALGCLEVLHIEAHDTHSKMCKYRPAPCPKGCGETVPVGRLERHILRCGRGSTVVKDAEAYVALLSGTDDAPICRDTLLEIVDLLRDEMALQVERVRNEARAQAEARVAAAQATFAQELAALREELGLAARHVAAAPLAPSAPPSAPTDASPSAQVTAMLGSMNFEDALEQAVAHALAANRSETSSPELADGDTAAAEPQTVIAVTDHPHLLAAIQMQSTFPSMTNGGDVMYCCDLCNTISFSDVGRLRCTQGCDFDLCDKCGMAASAMLTVGHAHRVAPVSQATEHSEMASFSRGWSCDLCKKSHRGNDVRLRCVAGCDYDACQACAAAAQTQATPPSSQECHPEPGDVVLLTDDYASHDDASDGPLRMGAAAVVLQDDGSDLPLEVRTKIGMEWWYSRKALYVIARPFDLVTAELIRVATSVPVQRGPDWKWDNQDGGEGKIGWTIAGSDDADWVRVEWPSGSENNYRVGPASFDLVVARVPT